MNKPPPLPWAVRSQPERMLLMVLSSAAVFGIVLLVLPIAGGHYFCIWKSVTGVPCAGCGGTRAMMLAFGGHWWDALRMNPGALLVGTGWIAGMVYSMAVVVFRFEPWRPSGRLGTSWRWWVLAGIAVNWVYVLMAGRA